MIELILIAGDPEIARYAVDAGVGRVFVDLELIGKRERQGHLDTVISGHTLADVERVRRAVPDARLMVRTNPEHPGLDDEVRRVLDAGADLVMPPMIADPESVARMAERVAGRAGLVPLVETPAGFARAAEIAAVPGVAEVYFGLNDAHLAMGLSFMFEIVAAGWMDAAAAACRGAGRPFGFGGIAQMEGDQLPGARVLGEHVRLGSSAVILSRAFHGGSRTLEELRARVDLPAAIARLREEEARLARRTPAEAAADRDAAWATIREIARRRRTAAP